VPPYSIIRGKFLSSRIRLSKCHSALTLIILFDCLPSMRKKDHLIQCLRVGIFAMWLCFGWVSFISTDGVAYPQLSSGLERRTYRYTMRGEVRLLLFWLSRDGVGGGQISFSTVGEQNSSRKTEQLEILFGSNPDRVPGKINRWGYGKEITTWVRNRPEEPFQIQESQFEGLMRHSEEEGLTQVLSNSSSKSTPEQFQYDATDSRITRGEAKYQVRIFSDPRECNYLHPEWLLSRYENEIKKQPATRQKILHPLLPPFSLPYGFLTALQELIQQLVQLHNQNRGLLRSARPALVYGYNAKFYRLEVQSVEVSPQFNFPFSSGAPAARVQFQVTNLVRKSRTQFSLFFDLVGEHSGIPFRIIHQPRWWLRIQLDLDPKRLPERRSEQIFRTAPLPGKTAMEKEEPKQ
jgi:hypothetical protein